jgi:Flp pilus assembly protein TadG
MPMSWPSRRRNQRPARRLQGDDGAALVEFAILAIPLFTIVFGVIEFGWAFFQNLDVRHGAREGARLAAVNYRETTTATSAEQLTQIVNETCDRMDSGDNVVVRFHRTGTSAVGQVIQVRVQKPLDQLTGFLDFALGGVTLRSDIEIRIEQRATWDNMGAAETRSCP